ncbi:hypothetical protein BDU57DRAFT_527108 [Ampelomyces quisqualis]|uniref:FAD-binding domain-containing protein n=1 Tax=Ampelomyces quisqualis TaxID=50730 RepID=A0A6A5QVX9_AMPQU|nr:hypothetical protein BDU57DRAFT_527108 [Ampelomyces quisqualis]
MGHTLTYARLFYPTTFVERETVLQTLYGNLQDKSKIQVAKRITKVDHNTNEVIVLCEDGTAFSGDILIGCDGVYSKVREELWRTGNTQTTAMLDVKDKDSVSAEYNCLFGISTATQHIKDGDIHINYTAGCSTMIIGSKSKVFWFIFKRLDRVYTMPNIPRYTKLDAEMFAAQFCSKPITREVCFGDIWDNQVSYTLVATEEGQLKRWSWGRIACIGDSAHKMTPNLGQGGNTAIESAAALANELKDMVNNAEKGKPSLDSIVRHLENYQKIREQRVTAISAVANGLTRVHALKTWKQRLMAFWILPNAGDILTDISCDLIIGAVKIDYLPVPERSLHGTMPFNPSQGVGKVESKLLRALKALPFLGVSAVAVYCMWGIALPPMIERIGQIMDVGVDSKIGQLGHLNTYESFYGLEFVDTRIRGLAACFASFQFVDVVSSWQSFTFLTDVGIVYAILLIEAARTANYMTFSYVQFFGIGVLMAVYCFLHYIQSPIEKFRARDMRLTDMSYTASILPLLLLVHYIPNLASFSTFLDLQTRHTWNWIWQPMPVYISILQFVLKKTVMPDTMKQDRIHDPSRDLPTIRYTIGGLCAISTVTWWYTLYAAPCSWATLFVPNLTAGQTGDEYVRLFMQCDEIFSMGAVCLWLLYLYGDLKKAGMMGDSWLSVLFKGTVLLVFSGPGVAVGLGWLYRERLLATRWHKDALVPGKEN